MRVGIQTPPEHTTFSRLRDLWQAADELGFHSAYTFDHFVPLNPGERPGAGQTRERRGAQFEGWTALAALAASTRRLQVGTLVSGVTYRHPVVLAKMAVTVDHVTGGRAVLGVGAAWHGEEHERFGFDFPPVGERMGRLDETLAIFRALCGAGGSGAPGTTVSFDGRWYRLDEAVFEPGPVRPSGLPVLVGGSGPRLKRIAARHADVFNSFSAPWEWPALNAELDGLLADVGRVPDALERSVMVMAELSQDADRQAAAIRVFQETRGGTETEVRRRMLIGSADDMAAVLRSFAEAGVETAIFGLRPHTTVADLAWFAREVLPAVV